MRHLMTILRELMSWGRGFKVSLHFDTIWSAVYNLNSLYNEICEGNPSKKTFKYDNRLDWGLKKNLLKMMQEYV